jgi:hypothetical protein
MDRYRMGTMMASSKCKFAYETLMFEYWTLTSIGFKCLLEVYLSMFVIQCNSG